MSENDQLVKNKFDMSRIDVMREQWMENGERTRRNFITYG